MQRKAVLVFAASVLLVLLWAPWLDDGEIRERILKERGRVDGTVVPLEVFENTSEFQRLLERSREMGVENGILLCDYRVMWFPFGRYVASCEGGYYVTFWGEPLYPVEH